MRYLDNNDAVVKWASEELFVPYLDPTTGQYRRYFPDFVVKTRDEKWGERVTMVEIKPFEQTRPPKEPKTGAKKNNKRYLREVKTYSINSYKWDAAEKYCKRRGWEFKIITERELGQAYAKGKN